MKTYLIVLVILFSFTNSFSQETKCECYSKSGIQGKTGIGGWTSVTGVNEQGQKKNYGFYTAYFPSQELCIPRDNIWWQKVTASILNAVASNATLIQSQKSTSEDARSTKKSISIAGGAFITQNDIDRLRQNVDYVIEVNAGLSSFASPLKKCSEINKEKPSNNKETSKSDSNKSDSDKKETEKVITKEEHDQYVRNAENYKSEQNLKNLKTRGYTDGQARVMINYEREKQADARIMNSVSNLTTSLFEYDEDKYFASQNRKIAKMKERRRKKAEKKKEKAEIQKETRLKKNMEKLNEEVNIELDKLKEIRIAKGDILRTERIKRLLKEGQGEIKSYFETGELKSVINYKDGEYKLYYISGQLDIVTNFKDGKINGLKKRYHRNGELMYEETYKNGLIYGKIKYFDSKGNLKSTKIYKLVN